MMCKLKGQTEKGHYDVQIKRWMKKVALFAHDAKRWHYQMQIKKG